HELARSGRDLGGAGDDVAGHGRVSLNLAASGLNDELGARHHAEGVSSTRRRYDVGGENAQTTGVTPAQAGAQVTSKPVCACSLEAARETQHTGARAERCPACPPPRA